MSTVPTYFSAITPVRLVPDANAIRVIPVGIGDTGPIYDIQRGRYTAAVPGSPATPQKSGPGLPGYEPAKPATPEVPESFVIHESTRLVLTQPEWDNWDKSVSDEAYILGIAAARTSSVLV